MRARPGKRAAWVLGLSLAAGIPAGLAMGTYQAATLADSGDIFGNSEFVVLEPEKWLGKPFPLLRYIDIGEQLATGTWLVVLYDHSCPACQKVVAKYGSRADGLPARPNPMRVAFVELPPYGDTFAAAALRHSGFVVGRVEDARKWFVALPVLLVLDQGIAVDVDSGSPLEADVPGQEGAAGLNAASRAPYRQRISPTRWLFPPDLPLVYAEKGMASSAPPAWLLSCCSVTVPSA